LAVARRLLCAAVLAVVVVAVPSCGGGGPTPLVLDGSPRFPDDEGLVTDVDLDTVTLDAERTYDISDELRSFSALDLSTAPLLFSDGQYAQVGLHGDTVVWLGTVARPVGVDPPVVYFTDAVAEVANGNLTFAGGLVLRLADDRDAPAAGTVVRAELDVEAGAVRALAVLADQ